MMFLLDAQMPPGLVAHLHAAGHDGTHVRDVLPVDAGDRVVAEAANRLSAVLITKDFDFIDLAARGILRMPLVWVRAGNMSKRRTVDLLLPALTRVVAAIDAGERIVEIR